MADVTPPQRNTASPRMTADGSTVHRRRGEVAASTTVSCSEIYPGIVFGAR